MPWPEARAPAGILLGLAFLAGCGAPGRNAETASPAGSAGTPEEPGVVLLTGSLEATGGQRLLAPITSTWIDLQLQWLVPDGSQVEAGDVVARFDPGAVLDGLADLEASLEEKEREARLAGVRARRSRLQLEVKLAEATAEARKAALEAAVPADVAGEWAHRKATLAATRKENERRRAELELRVHDLVEAARKAQLDLELGELRRKIEERRRDLAALELRAERAGYVLVAEHPWEEHRLRPGDRVGTGWEVARIPDPASLHVLGWAREGDVDELAPGQPARYFLDALPGRVFHGRVERVAVSGERVGSWGRGRWFRVELSLDDPDPEAMRPGMGVRCEIGGVEPGPPPPSSTVVPGKAPVRGNGRVVARDAVPVLPPRVHRMWRFTITWMIDEGKAVREGEPVFALDDRELRDRLEIATGKLETARKELEAAVLEEEDLLAALDLERIELQGEARKLDQALAVPEDLRGRNELAALRVDRELVARKLELLDRRVATQREARDLRVGLARARVADLEREVANLRRDIDRLRVRAPRAGYVAYVATWDGSRHEVGDKVWRGSRILEIADLRSLEVAASVPETAAPRVREGLPAEIRLDAAPDRVFHGRVRKVGRVFHARSSEVPERVFDVIVTIDDPDRDLLRPGMAASVEIFPGDAAEGSR